jgi:hypothetical protein
MININTEIKAQDKQRYEIEREQQRIDDTLQLLRRIYHNCKGKFGKVLTADYLKEKSLPSQMTGVLADKKYVSVRGIGAGKMFMWMKDMPTEQMAEEVWRESIRVRNDYEQTKLRERTGDSPNRFNIGTKHFVRILTPVKKEETLLKKQPTTVTEVTTLKILKIVKMLLTTGQLVMDFASMCHTHGISIRYEKAMLKCGLVARTNRGFEWTGTDDVDYELVRKVIDAGKTLSDVEMDLPTPIIRPTHEVKSNTIIKTEIKKKDDEIISEFEKATNSVQAGQLDRKDKFLFNLFSLLQELHKDLNSDVVKFMAPYCRKYNITENIIAILKKMNIIQKGEIGYDWIAAAPDKALTEAVEANYRKRDKAYHDKKYHTEFAKTKGFTTLPEKKGKTVLKSILEEVAKDKKDTEKLTLLAEKFAKAGNLKMAEQLLDQALAGA